MDELEKNQDEFDLEDILKEFSDEDPETPAAQPLDEPDAPEVTQDTVRLDAIAGMAKKQETGDATVRFQPVGEEEEIPQIPEEPVQETVEPFSEDWEPDYDEPMGEYVPREPIIFRPKNRLRELKAKQAAVPHVHRNHHPFAFLRGNRTFPQDHRIGVNVIVDTLDRFGNIRLHSPDNFIRDRTAVERRELLHDRQIMQIRRHSISGQAGELIRNTVVLPVRFSLIEIRRFRPKVTASRMDDQPIRTVLTPVNFDKVISAAERSDTHVSLVRLDVTVTQQPFQFRLLRKTMWFYTDISSRRNFLMDQLIQLLQIKPLCIQPDCKDSAADVHADQPGGNAVDERHRQPDHTAFSGVNVRHNADSAACGKRKSAEFAEHSFGTAVDGVSINDSGVVGILYGKQNRILLLIFAFIIS